MRAMNYFFLYKKALRIICKKKGIVLSEQEMAILYTCYLLRSMEGRITRLTILRFLRTNGNGATDGTILLATNRFAAEGYLSTTRVKREGRPGLVYTVQPALVMLIKEFEAILRRTRYDR